MRKVWKQRAIAIFMLVLLMGGTAAISVTLMQTTLALAIVVLFGLVAVLLVISRFKR